MLDIKYIVENKENVIERINSRGPILTDEINKMCELYKEYTNLLQVVENAKASINEKSKQIGEIKRSGGDASAIMSEIEAYKLEANNPKVNELHKEYMDILLRIPNIPTESVPFGKDEDENVEVRKAGTIPTFDFEPRAHYEIGEMIDGLDFERASKVAKSRFVITKGQVARLERAITSFMLDTHTKRGYTEFAVPVIANEDTLLGGGQLPKFADDLFKISSTNNDEDEFSAQTRDFYLIPTAEVILANYHGNEILDSKDLPFNYTGYSQCFRKEAGSAGRDTRGMIRVHQFGKVELFKYVDPKTSYNELDNMVADAAHILDALELPYRVITLCTGDMGFGAAKTFDIEVWFPSQNTYRECSSCSNVEDFQARRAKIRVRDEDNKVTFPHMLNGSGMATGRILASVLENYQNADGTINIPTVLKPYMDM